MQLLGPVRFSFLALTLACLAIAQDPTTAYPESTTNVDVTSRDLTTKTADDSTTVDTTEAGFRSGETETTDDGDQPTTVDQQSTTESVDVTSVTADATSTEDGADSTTPAEEEAKKEHVPDVAETSTAAAPERKPVKEPPFIKKYWPLLCLATKCDKRGSAPAPAIPSPDAPEVRSDLDETRFANAGEAEDDGSTEVVKGSEGRSSAEVLKELEEQMLADRAATDSSHTTDQSVETTRFSSVGSSEEDGIPAKAETTTHKSSSEEKDNDDDDDDDDDDKKDDDDDDDDKKDDDD